METKKAVRSKEEKIADIERRIQKHMEAVSKLEAKKTSIIKRAEKAVPQTKTIKRALNVLVRSGLMTQEAAEEKLKALPSEE